MNTYLRRTAGKTKWDRKPNERIKEIVQQEPVTKKIEKIWRHVECGVQAYNRNVARKINKQSTRDGNNEKKKKWKIQEDLDTRNTGIRKIEKENNGRNENCIKRPKKMEKFYNWDMDILNPTFERT